MTVLPEQREGQVDVDALAQEIRSVDGSHSLGAGALAEALAPYIASIAAIESAGAGEAVYQCRPKCIKAWSDCDRETFDRLPRDQYDVRILYTHAAPEQAKACVICGETEPYTGTCGSNDPRALCKLAAILADGRTTTDSGLPVTVLELIDVQQAAAREIRELAAPEQGAVTDARLTACIEGIGLAKMALMAGDPVKARERLDAISDRLDALTQPGAVR